MNYVISQLIGYIEDCFDVSSASISKYSTLANFEPDELDLTLLLTEIDLDFHVNIGQVYGDNLLTTPVYEIAEYLEKNEKK